VSIKKHSCVYLTALEHQFIPPAALLLACGIIHYLGYHTLNDIQLAAAAFGYYGTLAAIAIPLVTTPVRGITIPIGALALASITSWEPYSRYPELFIGLAGAVLIPVALLLLRTLLSAKLGLPSGKTLLYIGLYWYCVIFAIFGISLLKQADPNERFEVMTLGEVEESPGAIAQRILEKEESSLAALIQELEGYAKTLVVDIEELQPDIPDAIEKLYASQSAWIAYRDAKLACDWPNRNKSRYGTIHSARYNLAKADLTQKRLSELNALKAATLSVPDVWGPTWPD